MGAISNLNYRHAYFNFYYIARISSRKHSFFLYNVIVVQDASKKILYIFKPFSNLNICPKCFSQYILNCIFLFSPTVHLLYSSCIPQYMCPSQLHSCSPAVLVQTSCFSTTHPSITFSNQLYNKDINILLSRLHWPEKNAKCFKRKNINKQILVLLKLRSNFLIWKSKLH